MLHVLFLDNFPISKEQNFSKNSNILKSLFCIFINVETKNLPKLPKIKKIYNTLVWIFINVEMLNAKKCVHL